MIGNYYTVREFLDLEGAPSRSTLQRLWRKGGGPTRYRETKPGHYGTTKGSRWGRVFLPREGADRWLGIWRAYHEPVPGRVL